MPIHIGSAYAAVPAITKRNPCGRISAPERMIELAGKIAQGRQNYALLHQNQTVVARYLRHHSFF